MKFSAKAAVSLKLITNLVTSFSTIYPVSSSHVVNVSGPNPYAQKRLRSFNMLSEPNGDEQFDFGYITTILNNIYLARGHLRKGPEWHRRNTYDEQLESELIEIVAAPSSKAPEVHVEKMWSEMYNSKDEKYTEDVAIKTKLDISLEEFFQKFLCDDAPVSLESLHRTAGDYDVKSTKWVNGSACGLNVKKRNVTYKHSIKMPLPRAPPFGEATKIQKMQRFGNNGICIITETWIKDVPLADCFYVADRMIAASNPDGGISLTIQFGNCFVKKSMFKRIIIAASTKEVSKFHRGFVESVRRTIERSCRQ